MVLHNTVMGYDRTLVRASGRGPWGWASISGVPKFFSALPHWAWYSAGPRSIWAEWAWSRPDGKL